MFNDDEYQRKRRERNLNESRVQKPRTGQQSEEMHVPESHDESDEFSERLEYEPYGQERAFFGEQDPVDDSQKEKRARYLQRLQDVQVQEGEPAMSRHEDEFRDEVHPEEQGNRASDSRTGASAGNRKQVTGQAVTFVKSSSTATKVVAGVIIALFLVFFIIGIVSVVNYFRDRANHQISPRVTAQELIDTLRDDDFERYSALFPGDNVAESFADRSTFESLKSNLHDQALATDYILVRQGNGRDLLIAMEYNEDDDVYEIHDVRIVPDDAKGMFVY